MATTTPALCGGNGLKLTLVWRKNMLRNRWIQFVLGLIIIVLPVMGTDVRAELSRPVVYVSFDSSTETVVLTSADLDGSEKLEACGVVSSLDWKPTDNGMLKASFLMPECGAFTLNWLDQEWVVDDTFFFTLDGWVFMLELPETKPVVYVSFDSSTETVVLTSADLDGSEKLEACGVVSSLECGAFTLNWLDQEWVVDDTFFFTLDGWVFMLGLPEPIFTNVVFLPYVGKNH